MAIWDINLPLIEGLWYIYILGLIYKLPVICSHDMTIRFMIMFTHIMATRDVNLPLFEGLRPNIQVTAYSFPWKIIVLVMRGV